MKRKYGLLSIALAAASIFCAPTDASAGGGGWWGRGGYRPKINDVVACIDNYTMTLNVGFVVPGAPAHLPFATFPVSASLWGAAVCDSHPGFDGWYGGFGSPGGYLGYGPVGYGPGGYGPGGVGLGGYGPCGGAYCNNLEIVPLAGVCTNEEIACRDHGSWFSATFDLLPLAADVCGYGYLDDLYVDRAQINIDGVSFFLDYRDIGPCADGWYPGYGWD